MDKIFDDKAWKILASPDRWCQGRGAEDRDGNKCRAASAEAVRWCMMTALTKVYGMQKSWLIGQYLFGTNGSMMAWNDSPTRKHSEVVEFLKERDL